MTRALVSTFVGVAAALLSLNSPNTYPDHLATSLLWGVLFGVGTYLVLGGVGWLRHKVRP